MMYQITGQDHAGKFAAGLIVDRETVTYAAPKLRWMLRWTLNKVRDYCKARGWKLAEVGE